MTASEATSSAPPLLTPLQGRPLNMESRELEALETKLANCSTVVTVFKQAEECALLHHGCDSYRACSMLMYGARAFGKGPDHGVPVSSLRFE